MLLVCVCVCASTKPSSKLRGKHMSVCYVYKLITSAGTAMFDSAPFTIVVLFIAPLFLLVSSPFYLCVFGVSAASVFGSHCTSTIQLLPI